MIVNNKLKLMAVNIKLIQANNLVQTTHRIGTSIINLKFSDAIPQYVRNDALTSKARHFCRILHHQIEQVKLHSPCLIGGETKKLIG